jgi:hypothetical protein
MHYTPCMRPTMRNIVFTIATLGGLAACASDTAGDDQEADRRKRDAGVVQTVDAATSTADASSGGGTSSGGTISCYTEGAPSNTCTLPVHCCFANYSAQHNGYCTTNSCAWGTIDCDGPEDCASGQHCCSSELRTSDGEPLGYRVACQSSACGSPPVHEELCHPGGAACSNGGTCVSAYDYNYDLPRTLYICR